MKLHLVLKHKWFDMIASGEKLEEYREIKPYWQDRLFDILLDKNGLPQNTWEIEGVKYSITPKKFDAIVFHRGYTATIIETEYKGLEVGLSNPLWSENNEFRRCFILKLGQILTPSV